MEVIIMSANQQIHIIDNGPGQNGGFVWNRLHSEREEICETLLKECAPGDGAPEAQQSTDAIHASNWRRELLQARLHKIDSALDRLMSGSYGDCCKCGRWIEDTKLEFDPAVAFCFECWERVQTEH
jgi:RNA polymerase-binding transcription factor DksA